MSHRRKSAKKETKYMRTMMVQGGHYILGPFGAPFQTRKETPMKRLRYLGLVILLAIMTCNASGQTFRQKERVISGNANLSKLDKEGAEAVKDDRLRKLLQDSSVSAIILQDRTTQGGATSGDYGYWILYAKGRNTNLKEEKISKEDYEWLINFADKVDED